MRILQVHNQYQTPGGEDTVQQAEGWLLRKYGHEVDTFVANNQDLSVRGFGAYRDDLKLIQKLSERYPLVASMHNLGVARAHHTMARYFQDAGEKGRARDFYIAAIRTDPWRIKSWLGLSSLYIPSRIHRSLQYVARGLGLLA